MMKHVLVTGASAGIGFEIVKLLTREGFEVWGTSRDPHRLPQMTHFHPLQMDVSKPLSIRKTLQAALLEAKEFHILINNAGNGYFSPVEKVPPEMLREQFETLLFGPLELIQMILPAMRRRKRGLIINISSLASRFPIPYMGPYSAAKAALSSLTGCLQLELKGMGIQVVDVQCGDIHTNFNQATRYFDPIDEPDYQSSLQTVKQTIDCNMMSAPSPQIVAAAVLKLIYQATAPPIICVGELFQSKVAPLLACLVPRRLIQWGIRTYYHLN